MRATLILHILFNVSGLEERFLFQPPPENAGEERHSVDEGVSKFYPFGVKEASGRPGFARAKYTPSETQYMYIQYNMSMGKAGKPGGLTSVKNRRPGTKYYGTFPRMQRGGFDDTGRRIRAD